MKKPYLYDRSYLSKYSPSSGLKLEQFVVGCDDKKMVNIQRCIGNFHRSVQLRSGIVTWADVGDIYSQGLK